MQDTVAEKSSPWFDSPERAKALRDQCERWRGTPFSGNGEAPGLGVSCHFLVIAIYSALEVIPRDSLRPVMPMNHWRFSNRPLVDEYMAMRPEFVRLEHALPDLIRTGDLLGYRLGKIVYHLGIALSPLELFSVVVGATATNCSIYDATWLSRLAAIWRPMK
jgi:cell wall-associated NlpC family hydrolase